MADEFKKDIIIDIQAGNLDESIQKMATLRERQDQLKDRVKAYREELKQLQKAEKEGETLSEAEIARKRTLREQIELTATEVRSYNRYINDYQKVVQKSIDEEHRQAGSLREMRSRVAELTVEWENLSKQQREGARGEEVQAELANLNSTINEASLSTKNFKDNIGNYQYALEGLTGTNTLAGKAFQSLGVDSNMTANTLKTNVVGGVKSVGASFKALMANPIFAVIAGVTAILMAIVSAIKKNQDAVDAFQRILAPFTKLLDIAFDFLGKIGNIIGKVIEGFFNLFGAADSVATQAVRLQQELEKEEIALTTRRAERDLKIAKLNDEMLKRSQYTHDELIKMAEEVKKLRDEELNEEAANLQKRIKLWHLQDAKTKTSREEEQKLADLHAEMYRLEARRLESTRRHTTLIDRERRAVEAETEALQRQQEAIRKANEARIESMRILEKKTLQEITDILVDHLEDAQEKEIRMLRIKHAREVDEIKEQLKDTENLTEKARANLLYKIELLNNKYFEDLNALNEKHAIENYNVEIAALQELEKDKLQISADALKERIRMNTAISVEGQEQLLSEITELERGYKKEVLQEEAQERLLDMQIRLEQRRAELESEAELELEYATFLHEELLNLDKEQKELLYESDKEYNLALLESKNKLSEAERALQDEIFATAQMQLASVGAIAGAMSSLINEVATSSDAMSKFGKALALVNIATSSAEGIAAAVKAGAGKPFPLNLAAIAMGVGAVTSGISAAYKALSPTQPAKPKELGKKSVSVTMPARSVISSSVATDAPFISELGTIEAREAEQPQPVVVAKITDINEMQDTVKIKESFATE